NLSVDQILSLKNQNVSDSVIKALMSGSGSATAPSVATAAPAAVPTPATPPPVAAPATPPPAAPPVQVAAAAPTAAPMAPPPGAPEVAPPAEPGVSLDAFQAQLAPYGNWVQVPGYGPCWQPTAALADPLWRPYFDGGHWIYTDAGWSWQS